MAQGEARTATPTARMRRAVWEVLRGGNPTPLGGGAVRQLEDRLSHYLGGRALAVSSGTAALEVALRAAGVGPGDEVVLPAYDWGAATGAVLRCGAQPVFADVDAVRATLEATSLAATITSRTVAVVVTHFAGCPADLDAVLAVARSAGLFVLEDCAQALGAHHAGRPVGSFGDAAAFSFGAGKLVCGGEGGAVVFRDVAVWRRAVGLSQHPLRQAREGVNGLGDLALNARMHPLAAALVVAQWELWPAWLDRRRRACLSVSRRLTHVGGVVVPADPPGGTHSFHRYVLRFDDERVAERVKTALAAHGWPVTDGPVRHPLHQRGPFRARYSPGDCPQAERWSRCAIGVDQDWTRAPRGWPRRFADAVARDVQAAREDPCR